MKSRTVALNTWLKMGIAIALAIILLIAAIITIISLSPRDVSQNSPPIISARIASFTVDTSWNNPVGVTMAITFNVTVCNNGTVDINGGNLTVQRVRNYVPMITQTKITRPSIITENLAFCTQEKQDKLSLLPSWVWMCTVKWLVQITWCSLDATEQLLMSVHYVKNQTNIFICKSVIASLQGAITWVKGQGMEK